MIESLPPAKRPRLDGQSQVVLPLEGGGLDCICGDDSSAEDLPRLTNDLDGELEKCKFGNHSQPIDTDSFFFRTQSFKQYLQPQKLSEIEEKCATTFPEAKQYHETLLRYLHDAFPEFVADNLFVIAAKLCAMSELCRSERADCTVQFIEKYAGSGNLSKALLNAGFKGIAFDKLYGHRHNLLEPVGLREWCLGTCRLEKGGLDWSGLACKPFVFVSSSKHGRNSLTVCGKGKISKGPAWAPHGESLAPLFLRIFRQLGTYILIYWILFSKLFF